MIHHQDMSGQFVFLQFDSLSSIFRPKSWRVPDSPKGRPCSPFKRIHLVERFLLDIYIGLFFYQGLVLKSAVFHVCFFYKFAVVFQLCFSNKCPVLVIWSRLLLSLKEPKDQATQTHHVLPWVGIRHGHGLSSGIELLPGNERTTGFTR